MEENKSEFLNELCELLKKTRALGDPRGNPLSRIEYVVDGHGNEYARPIFADGSGENGYYDVCITGDSCVAILTDLSRFYSRY